MIELSGCVVVRDSFFSIKFGFQEIRKAYCVCVCGPVDVVSSWAVVFFRSDSLHPFFFFFKQDVKLCLVPTHFGPPSLVPFSGFFGKLC